MLKTLDAILSVTQHDHEEVNSIVIPGNVAGMLSLHYRKVMRKCFVSSEDCLSACEVYLTLGTVVICRSVFGCFPFLIYATTFVGSETRQSLMDRQALMELRFS